MSHVKRDDRILIKLIVWLLLAAGAWRTGALTKQATDDAHIGSLWGLETELSPLEAERIWNSLVFVDDSQSPGCGVTRRQRIQALRESLHADIWFILTYAPLLALSCHLVALGVRSLSRRAFVVGVMLVPATIVAGLLDVLENIGLKHMLCHDAFQRDLVAAIAIPSRIKWSIIHVSVLFVAAGLPFAAARLARSLWHRLAVRPDTQKKNAAC